MSEITLNIYKAGSKTEVEKTYKTQGYDLMLGTVDDFMSIFDIDKLGDNAEMAKMLLKGYNQIKPLFMDVFPELTADEFKRTKVNDLINTVMEIGVAVIESLDYLKSSKN